MCSFIYLYQQFVPTHTKYPQFFENHYFTSCPLANLFFLACPLCSPTPEDPPYREASCVSSDISDINKDGRQDSSHRRCPLIRFNDQFKPNQQQKQTLEQTSAEKNDLKNGVLTLQTSSTAHLSLHLTLKSGSSVQLPADSVFTDVDYTANQLPSRIKRQEVLE